MAPEDDWCLTECLTECLLNEATTCREDCVLVRAEHMQCWSIESSNVHDYEHISMLRSIQCYVAAGLLPGYVVWCDVGICEHASSPFEAYLTEVQLGMIKRILEVRARSIINRHSR